MTPDVATGATLGHLDDATRALVRVSAIVAGGRDEDIREAVAFARQQAPAIWIEELLLQSYLFAGFPRALNAMREWRRVHPEPVAPDGVANVEAWRADGLVTCAAVYGDMYDRLRENIRALHPLLDEWMIVDGYGKILSRPGLDLPRRELCVVAACASSRQDRQLHSHLHGALNVGVHPLVIDALIDAIADIVGEAHTPSVRMLWARVRGK